MSMIIRSHCDCDRHHDHDDNPQDDGPGNQRSRHGGSLKPIRHGRFVLLPSQPARFAVLAPLALSLSRFRLGGQRKKCAAA